MMLLLTRCDIPGRSVRILALATVLALCTPRPGLTAEPAWDDGDLSYDRARRAVRSGEAMPLPQAMIRLHETIQGKLIATEYEYEFDRWVYEFTVIDMEGKLRRVHLDARTGELVQVTDD
jgi:uncharacterized membrane protein YkoI